MTLKADRMQVIWQLSHTDKYVPCMHKVSVRHDAKWALHKIVIKAFFHMKLDAGEKPDARKTLWFFCIPSGFSVTVLWYWFVVVTEAYKSSGQCCRDK